MFNYFGILAQSLFFMPDLTAGIRVMLSLRRVLFLFFLIPSGIFAGESLGRIIAPGLDQDSISIGDTVYFYEDKENKITFDDVVKEEFNKNFILNPKNVLSFGYTQSAIWVKFQIREPALEKRDWLLEIGFPHLDRIEIYSQDLSEWKLMVLGDSLPFSNRPVLYRNFVYRLDIPPGSVKTFYMKIGSQTSMLIPLKLFTPDAFLQESNSMERFYFLIYGIMAIMVIFNGFIFWSFRSLSFLLYSLTGISILLFYIAFNGHGFQMLWPGSIFWQNHSVAFLTGASWIAIIAFTNRFLDLKRNSKFFFFALTFLQFYFLFSLVTTFFFLQKTAIINAPAGLILSALILLAALNSFRMGNRSARFFVFAWITFLAGAVLTVLRVLGFMPENIFTVHTIQIGSMIQLVLLALALADRFKYIQQENLIVQTQLFESQKHISENLELKVVERTAELNMNMKLIQEDLATARKIQESTLPSGLHKLNFLEMDAKYLAMSEVGGDFYSVDELDALTVRIFLADATGHGVQAALITMAIKGIYDSLKGYALPPNEILGIFNRDFIYRYGSLNSFLTCIVLDIDTKNRKIIYSSAGHPSAVLLTEKGKILLGKTGSLIGVMDNAIYRAEEQSFSKNDRLFVVTDGVFEEFRGEEEFGETRLHEILEENRASDLKYTIGKVISELNDFLGPTGKQDDITILGIGFL